MKRFSKDDKVIYNGRARGFDNGSGEHKAIWSGQRGIVRGVTGELVQVECVIHGERLDLLIDADDLKLEVFRSRGATAPAARGILGTLLEYLHG